MRSTLKVMVREDPKLSLFINKTWVCIDLREIIDQSMVLEYCLNEEEIGITHYPQITPESPFPLSRNTLKYIVPRKKNPPKV